ncbi:DNA cytosine methyltransferase [Oceanibacterium hippocampi]|uniref:DNA cytosine methyltransferase n=1 Tax=Oceanibacterium hippocampi TaxID=745714 RepID=UPI00111C3BF5|nr:DNA cytosine methyltransferase [Oceanibacterium hippocampi]
MSDGLVIDNFAGGGGASTGLEQALGRVDVAINHDPRAVAMHEANHPETRHHCQSVWRADPLDVTGGRPVRCAWFSPDCTYFSKAKGAAPIRDGQRHRRDLAWVVVLWAERVRPAVILLENVEEFRDWGPLLENGRPCPVSKGMTFRRWKRQLQRLGYRVEHRELRACDYGVPTSRKRLFVVARCDGLPIVWPDPTHGDPASEAVAAGALRPWATAASVLDWSQPIYSIFLTREEVKARRLPCRRPLADNTMARIARGVQRYVLDAAEPFIVPITHTANKSVHGIHDPLRTITTAHGGEFSLVSPFFVPRYGERAGQAPRSSGPAEPMPTIVPTANGASLVAAFMAQHNLGMVGHPLTDPLSTITTRGTQQQLVASHLMKFRGTCRDGQPLARPVPTVTSGSEHLAEVRAFLIKYYGAGIGQAAADPLHTITTQDRFGLVTVAGEDYAIADIGMRMLTPRELFSAQGFPSDYRIDFEYRGKPLSKVAQIELCGNSVPPGLARALAAANVPGALSIEAAA